MAYDWKLVIAERGENAGSYGSNGLINHKISYIGKDVSEMIHTMFREAKESDVVEIYQKSKSDWKLLNRGAFPFAIPGYTDVDLASRVFEETLNRLGKI